MEAQVRSQGSPCEISGGRSDYGTSFGPANYYTTNAPFIYLLSLPVRSFIVLTSPFTRTAEKRREVTNDACHKTSTKAVEKVPTLQLQSLE